MGYIVVDSLSLVGASLPTFLAVRDTDQMDHCVDRR